MPAFPQSLVARLARKELREILRDRRTIVTLVLMPVLLYPILGMAFRHFLLTVAPPAGPQYRIGVPTLAEGQKLAAILNNEDPHFTFFESAYPETNVLADDVELGARRLEGGPGQERWEIVARSDSPASKRALRLLQERLAARNIEVLQHRLKGRGLPAAVPFQVELREVTLPEEKKASYLAALVPLVLVLMTITGAVYPAIDLTAGERERGTLQLLMAAPVSRVGLLLGKYVAVMTVAMLTALINLTMMTVTLAVTGLGAQLFPEGFSVLTVLAVLGLLLLFAAFFSAVLLAITSFARSFKEAQAYLIPVMLLALSPGMLSLMPGLKLGGLLTIAPLVNVVLLAREVLEGSVSAAAAAVVVLSTLLYAMAAITVAARLFGAEAVLYSEQGHFSEIFRRPARSRSTASLNAALLCLALAFPLAFLLNGLVAQARDFPIEGQMLLLAAVLVVLFVGMPLASAYLSRVEPASGFALGLPKPLALTGALLLGLSLWPFVFELIALQERIGFGTMPAALREASRGAVENWRLSPALVFLAMAIVPGVVEELFFRGYLFSALLSVSRPWLTILVTALAFGVFHIFPSGILAAERLLPSTLMGLVLGWVRWRGGSIWPGVLLHAAHNSLLLAIALFPDVLFQNLGEGDQVPLMWLLGALAVAPVGAALVWWGSKDASSQPE